MSFNSAEYAIFLPIVFILYWALPNKYRWILVLGASYFFYMNWNPKYVVLILFTTIVSYTCGLLLEKTNNKGRKKLIVVVALILCLGVLFVFKYFNFTFSLIGRLVHFSIPELKLMLPVGISFYTFQTLSYVIDVYRGDVKAEKHFGIYATFVTFFPQLVAGPIERSSRLLPQIRQEHEFNAENANTGMRLIVWGLFKKIVVADNFSYYVDMIYGNIRNYTGFSLLLSGIFFALQLYCDFSAYSDIARGSAKLFGIELMQNFKSPLISTSVRELWAKWHISLTSWFRDYIYIPLGGNRKGKLRHCINTMIVFTISGLWHGASLTFVAWGVVNGLALVFENVLGIKSRKKRDFIAHIRMIIVFLFFSWTMFFFRAQRMSDVVYANLNMFKGISHPGQYLANGFADYGIDIYSIGKFAVFIVPLLIVDYISNFEDVIEWMGKQKAWMRHLFMIVTIVLILFFGYFAKSSFIYFQF